MKPRSKSITGSHQLKQKSKFVIKHARICHPLHLLRLDALLFVFSLHCFYSEELRWNRVQAPPEFG